MNCSVCGAAVQPGETVCRTCGAPLTPSGLVALPAGTALAGGQYTLSRVLGQGGFGITYAGRDTRLGLQVAIKELFLDGSSRRGKTVAAPGNISSAEYQTTKTGFLDEAKVLASFNDPGIVKVMNYFEENSTAYLVMEFLEGSTLGGLIEKRGPMPPDVVFEVARSVAKTLELVHQRGLLHRDIKPDNIFFNQTGRIVLIDFGSVRAFVSGKTLSHTRLVTPGYAPLEQYGNSGRFGPYTDIYALGATLLHALTGKMPPPATDLMLGTPLPPMPDSALPGLRRAVTQAMALRVEDRPQSAQALLTILTTPTPRAVPSPPIPTAPSPQPPVPRPPVPQSPVPRPPVPQPPLPRPSAPRPVPAPVQPVVVPPKPAPRAAPPVPTPPVSTPLPRTPVPRTPTPIPVSPPSRTAPTPVPTPPPPPVPASTPSAAPPLPNLPAAKPPAPLFRTIFIVLSSLLGAGAVAWSLEEYVAAPIQTPQYALAAVGGAGAGALAGGLLWFALPLALPASAAAAAYFYTQGAGFHWPTVVSASVASAVLAIIFLILVRRISL
ncbi:serine/threonine-protein kinase [Deinococcus arenicola]|uniref:Serine/threonine-protein kinase n=1 Tax=Deinococcus arenicola TaxID=2994950 RepID=A0ABU4DUX6_9DEIO|nr:serine/threonine-protein kinase [Deinococcus sp. ZS9-10]MDV6376211.1 serine/threonine-protein kinase [Deinococcus sp. ZS9-10]